MDKIKFPIRVMVSEMMRDWIDARCEAIGLSTAHRHVFVRMILHDLMKQDSAFSGKQNENLLSLTPVAQSQPESTEVKPEYLAVGESAEGHKRLLRAQEATRGNRRQSA